MIGCCMSVMHDGMCVQILLGLSDAELESALRLESALHRRKMRLAIEELRDPATV